MRCTFWLLRGDTESFFNNRETRFYSLITAIAIVAVSGSLWLFDEYTIGSALRYGAFQAVSIHHHRGFRYR
ncbi:MAG: hypothetical protein U5J63_13035 [Fodinibius sp.]|nr:hypothetical protein [Fodinibius sp.]